MEKFGVGYNSPEDVFELNDPTYEDIKKLLTQDIPALIQADKKKNFLVVCLFAGHGILKHGM